MMLSHLSCLLLGQGGLGSGQWCRVAGLNQIGEWSWKVRVSKGNRA